MIDLTKDVRTTDAAYIAGFLDGDGYITIYPNGKVQSVKVGFSNTDRRPLLWIHGLLKMGNLYERKVSDLRIVKSQDVKRLLTLVLPYLRVKPLDAEIALAFLETKNEQLRKQLLENRKMRNVSSLVYPSLAELNLSPEVWSYLAGMIDADGSFSTNLKMPGLIIYNNSKPLIQWLDQVFPVANIYIDKRTTTFQWSCRRRQSILWIIRNISPYLKIKYAQAAEYRTHFWAAATTEQEDTRMGEATVSSARNRNLQEWVEVPTH
jgi:hypothetical protein